MKNFFTLIAILVLIAPGKGFGQTTPEILGVQFPDTTMKVGNLVDVVISVADDLGDVYTLNSGDIGGFLLSNLTRINNTLYQAEFVVAEGGTDYHESDDIPVVNLQLYNGIIPGNIWNQPVIQNNDLLDANTPIVESATILSTGKKKIGSEIIFLVTSDQSAYEMQESSHVNNVLFSDPDIYTSDIGNGNYNVRYTISEGDGDVSIGNLSLGVYAIDRAGNISSMFQTLDPNDLSIDANRPIINRAYISTLDSSIYVDEVVEIIVETDAPGYIVSGDTWINNVSVSESNLTYQDLGDDTYRFTYVVKENDQNVSKGDLEINIVFVDSYSNASLAFTSLDPNNLEIFTSRPSAVISGSTSICNGDSALISVSLGGVPPWVIALSDGTDIDIIGDIQESLFEFKVAPTTTTNYTIPLLRDGIDAHNTGIGNALITVNPVPDAEILNLPTEHDILGPPVELQADPVGGTFTGPGVTSSIPVSFYPSVAGVENSPHNIVYAFTDTNNCIGRDTVVVNVIEPSGYISFNKPIGCFNDEAVIITGINPSDSIGTFSIQPDVPGALVDSGNNVAVLNLLLYNITADLDFQITYTYTDSTGVEFSLERTLQVEYLLDAVIVALADNEFCQNSIPVSLNGNYPGAGIFEGSGVTGTPGDGYIFNPSLTQIGTNTIYYTYTSANSCSVQDSVELSTYPAPEADFTILDKCIPAIGGSVSFINNSDVGSSTQIGWSWDFDDIGSGSANYSSESDPSHYYSEAASKHVTLIVNIDHGCSDSIKQTLGIYPKPVADFSWTSNCLTTDPVVFEGTEQFISNDTIVGRKWIISEGSPLLEVDTVTAKQIQYSFSSTGNYYAFYCITSSLGCKDSIEEEIVLSPTYTLSGVEYLENFENALEGWSAFAGGGGQNSWNYGTIVGLEFPFTAASGTKAWHTDLPTPGSIENSWVQSPCFNFENPERPMLSIDIKQSMDRDLEGVVIQYTDDNGQNWNNIGAVDDGGLNWYNSTNISNGPGAQSTGWTGQAPFTEDTQWSNAAYQLDQLIGKTEVRFRIAYGSAGDNTNASSNGFAFDNFGIKERTRLALLEYYTNANSSGSSISDPIINGLTNNSHKDVVDIQYHTSYPIPDEINLENPVPASTRGLYYGVSEAPYATLDGGIFDPELGNDMRYDFVSRTPGNRDVSVRSLMEPDFLLTMEVIQLLPLQLSLTIEATENISGKELTLFTVVLEKSIEDPIYNGTNGITSFENIARKILPDAGGISYNRSWNAGEKENTTVNWDQPFEFLEEENIAVVVFIQDDATKEVLQAVKYNIQGIPTSVTNPAEVPVNKIRIYPNPAMDQVNIHFEKTFTEPLRLNIHDFSGRLIRIEEISAGIRTHTAYLRDLRRGMYILEIQDRNNNILFQRTKLLLH